MSKTNALQVVRYATAFFLIAAGVAMAIVPPWRGWDTNARGDTIETAPLGYFALFDPPPRQVATDNTRQGRDLFQEMGVRPPKPWRHVDLDWSRLALQYFALCFVAAVMFFSLRSHRTSET